MGVATPDYSGVLQRSLELKQCSKVLAATGQSIAATGQRKLQPAVSLKLQLTDADRVSQCARKPVDHRAAVTPGPARTVNRSRIWPFLSAINGGCAFEDQLTGELPSQRWSRT
ncbi:hypothetical protein FCN77_11495 [Arthrobacter sp. 24S4-2]|uniref:hypothetical protein n=1 Tax=Arthrobacter sp. 24S4-2 TaxID=2575374 RepID=UPI0010C79EDE|nr:hypothetical protein [Arthrobacter sp. 24S4-2]QCO98210.1 hypothetical protein FCN77_11495 [Arthrobacter sp. 24S4-2]